RTAAVRSAWCGSFSRSQSHLVMVNDEVGTLPVRRARVSAPYLSISAAACPAERTSFQSMAGLMGSPASSRVTRPCCWPPTETAPARSAQPVCSTAVQSARHHCWGSLSRPAPEETVCGARPSPTMAPPSTSTATALADWVELSLPITTRSADMVPPGFLGCPTAPPHTNLFLALTKRSPDD